LSRKNRRGNLDATFGVCDLDTDRTDTNGFLRMRANLDLRLDKLTEKIIGAAFNVSNTLGHGFLESVYKKALIEELTFTGLTLDVEKMFPIRYREKLIGNYVADLIIEDTIIVELKATDGLTPANKAQVLNYLKASMRPVGLLLNFGTPRLQLRRVLLPSVTIR